MSASVPTPPDRNERKYSTFRSAALPVFAVCTAWRQKSTRLAALKGKRPAVPNTSKASCVGQHRLAGMGRPSVGGRRKVGLVRHAGEGTWFAPSVLAQGWPSPREQHAAVVMPLAFPLRASSSSSQLCRAPSSSWFAPGSFGANPSLHRTAYGSR